VIVSVVRVTQIPQTLDELGEGLLLWEQLNTELPSIEAKISPLFDQFAILDKYEVTVAETVQSTLHDLPSKFRHFQETLVDADIMLKKQKVLNTSLTGRCLLSNEMHFNVGLHLPLCQEEEETTLHLLRRCSTLYCHLQVTSAPNVR